MSERSKGNFSSHLPSCVHVSSVHPVEDDATIGGGGRGGGEAKLDHLFWHRVDAGAPTKLGGFSLINKTKCATSTPLLHS